MDREDLRFGDIVRYESGNVLFVGRALGLLTREASVSSMGMGGVVILEPQGTLNGTAKPFIEAWSDWDANSSKLELEWGDWSKKFRTAASIVPVSLMCVKPLFDDADRKFFVKRGCCPRCGDSGVWVSLALACRWHGVFI